MGHWQELKADMQNLIEHIIAAEQPFVAGSREDVAAAASQQAELDSLSGFTPSAMCVRCSCV